MTRKILAAAVLALFAAPAMAQAPAMGNDCMSRQVERLCPGAKPGSSEYAVCMKEHAVDAAAACQQERVGKSRADTRKKLSGKSPCMDDMQKFCPGQWPGTPEFSACMKKHKSELTPACAAFAEKKMKEGHKPGDDVCVADAKKLCPGMTIADGSRFAACMSGHYDDLSAPCQAKFKGAKKGMSGEHADCMAAVQKLCPDATPGDPSMMRCMMEHHAELPASCRKHGGR